jgi:UDP-GlcNAc:undecaprenyl-phosphate GlcNAc-1-phosphate transferase
VPFGGVLDANRDALRVVLALSLLGGVMGFLPFNFNPASIFMGDTGSMFLGFSCATLIILSAEYGDPKWFMASLVMFALPIMDTALAFARRLVARRSVFSADRHHFHHQMVARGLSVKQTVLLAYGMTILFVVGGGAVAFLRTRYVIAAYLVTFGFMVVTAVKMGMVHERHRAVARKTLDQPTEPAPVRPAEFEPATVIDVRDEAQPSLAAE